MINFNTVKVGDALIHDHTHFSVTMVNDDQSIQVYVLEGCWDGLLLPNYVLDILDTPTGTRSMSTLPENWQHIVTKTYKLKTFRDDDDDGVAF